MDYPVPFKFFIKLLVNSNNKLLIKENQSDRIRIDKIFYCTDIKLYYVRTTSKNNKKIIF